MKNFGIILNNYFKNYFILAIDVIRGNQDENERLVNNVNNWLIYWLI